VCYRVATQCHACQAAASSCLQALLQLVINTYWRLLSTLQEASSLEQNVKGKAVSADTKRAQAVASIRREEGVLAQQASELAGQVSWREACSRRLGCRFGS
jgi:hypothetical protein